MKAKTIVAKVFVRDAQGLILVLRRSRFDTHRPLTWDLPGGEVEYSEDPVQSIIREAKEETRLVIRGPQIFHVSAVNSERGYAVRLFFYAMISDQEIKLSFEHDQYKWVSREELSELDIPEHYKEAIKTLPEPLALGVDSL